MAASTIDEQPLADIALEETISDASATLRRRLLAEIMPSVLHELSQPLTCVMLQHAVSRRALPSDTEVATDALAQAEAETKRAASLVESMNLLSAAQAEPLESLDLNPFVNRAAELLRRTLYDRRCALDCQLSLLPLALFSTTTALEAIVRAILLGSRMSSSEPSRLSVVTQLAKDGRFVQIGFCRTDAGGGQRFAVATECSNYAHVARAIQTGGGRIDLFGDQLIIAFPVVDGSRHQKVIAG